MYVVIAVLLGSVLVAPAQAQVQVDIGIHLPALPRLVVVPQVPAVQYVPAAPGNLFYYDDQYWVFANRLWHVSRGYNGPWIVVAPQFVPRPVLLVPVRYYPVRPGHWQRWVDHYPPRWHNDWGRDWAHNENGRTAPAVATTMTGAGAAAGTAGEATMTTMTAAREGAGAVQAFDAQDFKDVTVTVKNGVVRLTGTVPTGTRRLEAAVLARSVQGVRAVEDDLRVVAA